MIDAWIIENLNLTNIKHQRREGEPVFCDKRQFLTFLKLVPVGLWTHPEWVQRKWTKTEVKILKKSSQGPKKQEMETLEEGLDGLALSDISSGANLDIPFYQLIMMTILTHLSRRL